MASIHDEDLENIFTRKIWKKLRENISWVNLVVMKKLKMQGIKV